MYLACDYWREQGVLDDIRVVMVQPYPTVFGVPGVDEELDRKIAEYGIELRLNSELVAVDAAGQTALIRNNAAGATEELATTCSTPCRRSRRRTGSRPRSCRPPATTAGSSRSTRRPSGTRFPNVWSLGDAAATTNSKCGGALRKQTKVLAKNLVAARQGKPAAGEVQRLRGVPVHRVPLDRGVRRVRRPVPADAHHPQGAHVEREPRVVGGGPRHLPEVYWNLILKGRA